MKYSNKYLDNEKIYEYKFLCLGGIKHIIENPKQETSM